jgi:hypothetical protein
MSSSIEFRESINPGTTEVRLRSELNGKANHLNENQRRYIGIAFERAAARAVSAQDSDTDRAQGFDIFNVGMNEYVLFYQRRNHIAAPEEVDRLQKTIRTIREGDELAGRMRIQRGENGIEAVLFDATILDEAVA